MGGFQSKVQELSDRDKVKATEAINPLQLEARKHDEKIKQCQQECEQLNSEIERIWTLVGCEEDLLSVRHRAALNEHANRIDSLEDDIEYYRVQSREATDRARQIQRVVDDHQTTVLMHHAYNVVESVGGLSPDDLKKNYQKLSEQDGKLKNVSRLKEDNLRRTQSRAQFDKEVKEHKKLSLGETKSSMSDHILTAQKRVQARLNQQNRPPTSTTTDMLFPFNSSSSTTTTTTNPNVSVPWSLQEKIAMGEE